MFENIFEDGRAFLFSIIGLAVALFLFGCFTIVGVGQRGVVVTLGKVGGVKEEGIHFKVPLIQSVVKMNIQIQKVTATAQAASKDLQETTSKIALNYHVSPDKVNNIYQSIGKDYPTVIINPTIQEVVKSITAQYTAVELITTREAIRIQIKEAIAERLKKYNILVDDFSVLDFDFSEEFNKAIESKQAAEQGALKAQRDLDKVKFESEQKISRAKAEAESLRLQKEQVNEYVLRLRWIEKWDGKLPQFSGSGIMPMINMGQK